MPSTIESEKQSPKRRIFMADFKVVISYESDLEPVVTIRETIRANSVKSATIRAARLANKKRPHKRKFRSWVIVVERLSPERDGE